METTSRARPILIIDDDPSLLYLVNIVLKEVFPQHEVMDFTGGEELLNYLKKMEFDPSQAFPRLILMDVNMVGKSGFEVLQTIRQNPVFQEEPKIVLFSGVVHEELKQKALALGANQIFEKPFDLQGWYKQLKSLAPFLD